MGSSELQSVLYSVLTTALPDIPVYDYVPETADEPYIVIGEDYKTNIGGKTDPIYEITVSISVFSGYRGMKEVKELSSSILNAVSAIDTEYSGMFLRFLRLENVEHKKEGEEMRTAELSIVFTAS